jgi:hypothetical protein
MFLANMCMKGFHLFVLLLKRSSRTFDVCVSGDMYLATVGRKMYDIRTNAIWALAAVAAIGTSGYALSGWSDGDKETYRATSSKGSSSFSLGDAIASMRPAVDLIDEDATEVAYVGEIGKYVRKSWADDILRKALLQTAVAQTSAATPVAVSSYGWGGVANNIIQASAAGSSTGDAAANAAKSAVRTLSASLGSSSAGSIPIPSFGGQLTGLNGLNGLNALGAIPSLSLPAVTSPLTVTSLTQTAGSGSKPGSPTTAAIASVPLPAGALLLGSALLGLGFARRRKA